MKTKIGFIALLSLITVMYGCSSIKATADQDYKAKQLQPDDGKALVYFVRPAFVGKVINMKVSEGGKQLGVTRGKTFIYTMADPGNHLYKCKAENEAEIILNTEAGKTYYVNIIPQMGFIKARCKLEQVHPSEGKQMLDKCKLSKECAEVTGV